MGQDQSAEEEGKVEREIKEDEADTGASDPSATPAPANMRKKFAGTWSGDDGELYVIEEGSSKCKRIDQNEKVRTFSLRWNSGRGVVVWGRSYYADPADCDESGREIVWYKLRDKKKRERRYTWTKREGPILTRQSLLSFRNVVAPEGDAVEGPVKLGVAPCEELGVERPLDKMEHRLSRRRKKTDDSDVGGCAEMSAAWEYGEAHTEAVLSALMADPASAEMWPQYCMDPLYWGMPPWWTGGVEAWEDKPHRGQTKVAPQDRKIFEINRSAIERGTDLRTTVMIRNLAKAVTHASFSEFLTKCGLQDRYSFLYLPSGKGARRPCGIAFVNFRSPTDILKLLDEIEAGTGKSISTQPDGPPLVASYGRLQGQQQLSSHFGSSAAIVHVDAEKRPQFLTHEESSTEDSDTAKAAKGTASGGLKASAPVFKPSCGVMATAESTPDLSVSDAELTRCATESVVGEDLPDKVRSQVEYYFSVDNLCQDCYLRALMDADGWVKISDLAGFPRVQRTGLDIKEIAAALAFSEDLELCSEKLKVRSGDEGRRQAFGFLPTLPSPAMEPADFMASSDPQLGPMPECSLPSAALGAEAKTASPPLLPTKPPEGKTLENALAKARAAAAEHTAWIQGVTSMTYGTGVVAGSGTN